MATEPTSIVPGLDPDPYSAAPAGAASMASSSAGAFRTTIGIGTRQSALALAQTDLVLEALRPVHADLTFEVRKQQTAGDKNQATALHAFDAKALWTTELEAELASRRTDLVVHSLKDLPTQLPVGMTLGAALRRTERRDCVVMGPAHAAEGRKGLADLPAGSVVGTSSVRRLAQLRRAFPQLKSKDVRGNINTRLAKLDAEGGEFDALILAATGLQRLDMGGRVSSFLSRKEGGWLGAVGQGAVGIEVREGDAQAEQLCASAMRDLPGEGHGTGRRTLWECLAERSMLRVLEGGCTVPVAVETHWEGEQLVFYGLVASIDGSECVQADLRMKVSSVEEADGAGLEMARLLVEKGAGKILEVFTLNRKLIAESGGA